MFVTMTAGDPTRSVWLTRLESALRTTLACTVVGCTTLYGPASLRHLLTFPAFSYVTTILIVSDATLGDTLRGFCHALYGTIQVLILSVLTLWVIGPARYNSGLAAVAVAISAFVVALPESTPLMTKRIAFGQIVIVYVGAVIHGAETGVVMHPVHVASSTLLGALASILAMLVPYPRLAYHEVRKACRFYVENASERLNLFFKTFTACDNQVATNLISQAKILRKIGIKHLQNIKYSQGGMTWEKPQIIFLNHSCMNPGEKLSDMEICIRGMEIALTSCPSLPIGKTNEEIKEILLNMKNQISLKLEQAKCFAPFDATMAPETAGEYLENSLWIPQLIAANHEDLPAFFFMYCMELLLVHSPIGRSKWKTDTEQISNDKDQMKSRLWKIWKCPSGEGWNFAIKCSLSLGFAVFFGLIFNKENGYWSGLTIAISFVTGRQPTFTLANARAQGTAMGSVYGILICFIFHKFTDLRLLALLPWIVFTSFLRHSRIYGQSGAISAVIGALLILGRKNYGPPNEFAIARITEACIGLLCFIMVEILLQPARAATLARAELTSSLRALQDCIQNMVFYAGQKGVSPSTPQVLRIKQEKFKYHVNKLEKFIAEAQLEPNFWFLPFHGECHEKFLGSLRKMEDLLLFAAYEIDYVLQVSENLGVDWNELEEQMNSDLDLFREKIGFSLKCLEEVISFKSLARLENKLEKQNNSENIELGKSTAADAFRSLGASEDEFLEIVSSFLQHSVEVAKKISACEGEQKLKSHMMLCLNGLGFCISNLMKEMAQIEKELQELTTLENPTKLINLYEISQKINTLHTK